MEYSLFLKGLIIGFSLAVPIGPVGILCIRKTLMEGHFSGLVVGAGAATADAIYGCIAAFGLTVVSDILISEELWLRLIGGGFLLFLGVKTFLTHPEEQSTSANGKGLLASYASTFLLTLTNPLTIFAFVGIFAALGLGSGLSYFTAWTLVLGVFTGSCCWFLFLSYSVTLFRKKFNSVGIRWLNKISGALIIIFGVIAILSFH